MLHWVADGTTTGDSNLSTVAMGVGVALLIWFAFIRPAMRRKSDPLSRAPGFASLSQQRSTERQMQSLLVELSEMARQITAQLDSRAAKLEILIQQADQRIARLERAPLQSAAPIMKIVESSPPDTQADALPQTMPVDPRHLEIYQLADQGQKPAEIATELNRPRGEIELILALRGR